MHDTIYMKYLDKEVKNSFQGQNQFQWFPGAGGRRDWEVTAKLVQQFLSGVMETFQNYICYRNPGML
jgi:hypothetical protein